jgi:hypothetical protein
MENKNYACFDIILPTELSSVAKQKALEENAANISPFEAAALKSKLWSPGRTLTVCFLDDPGGASQSRAVCPAVGAIR